MKEPQQYEREKLAGMTIPELVGVILRQQEWAQQMYEEVEKLKAINNRNSKDSSKPPSSDFLKLSEKVKEVKEEEEEGKKKVGGQKGHKGKTRKGFNRVDRYEILSPEACPKCGSQAWTEIGTSVRQTARLVAKPLYNRGISTTAMSMSEL
jgi:transposase